MLDHWDWPAGWNPELQLSLLALWLGSAIVALLALAGGVLRAAIWGLPRLQRRRRAARRVALGAGAIGILGGLLTLGALLEAVAGRPDFELLLVAGTVGLSGAGLWRLLWPEPRARGDVITVADSPEQGLWQLRLSEGPQLDLLGLKGERGVRDLIVLRGRSLTELVGRVQAEDERGRLWALVLPGLLEPVMLLEMWDQIQPSGHRMVRFLRVPYRSRTPAQAIASRYLLPEEGE